MKQTKINIRIPISGIGSHICLAWRYTLMERVLVIIVEGGTSYV
jgi:hypothetical protein